MRVVLARLRPVALPALAVGTVFLAAVSGVAAIKLPLKAIELALGGLAVAFVTLSRPDFMILAILSVSSTIIWPTSLPMFRGFTVVEMCVILFLGLIVARTLSNREEFVRTPLDWPVFLFFAASTISNINAIHNLGTVDSFVNSVWRLLLNYMIFFAVTNLVRTRRQLMTLIGGMLIMATIVAALMVAQQAVGTSISIMPGRSGVATATALGQEQAGVVRTIGIPGIALAYVMLLPAFVLYTTPGFLPARKWLLLIPVVLIPLAVLFTFTRSMWLGAALASAILVLFPRIESRRVILLMLILAVGASLLVPLLTMYVPRITDVVDALSARFGSLFAGDELVYDSSTQWRIQENELAIAKIREYPLLGIGPTGQYRAPWSEGEISDGYCYLCRYIHNTYLYLLVDVGIVGFLPILWFSTVFLLRGFNAWRTAQDPVLRGLIVGFTLGYVGVLTSSMSSPRFVESNYIPLIGVMLGANEVAIRLVRRDSRSENGAA